MNKITLTKPLYLSLLLALWLGCVQGPAAQAQDCTLANTAPVPYKGWAKGETVQVYIDPAITGDRRTQVEQAFRNWSDNRFANGSLVNFTFVDQPPAVNTGVTVLNQQHPTSGNRETTIVRTDDNSGYTTNATTYLSPGVTYPPAVLETMSHGIGHTFGYEDCDTCSPSSSIMATSVRYTLDNDVIGRATSPTPCDNQQLQLVNYPNCPGTGSFDCAQSGGFWNESTCFCEPHNHGGGYDGGGFEYTCTPYYWVYYISLDGGRTWFEVDSWYAGCW